MKTFSNKQGIIKIEGETYYHFSHGGKWTSDKFIVLKVNLGISDKVSCPTEANMRPNTHIIIAFKKFPFDENAATAVKPNIINPK